MEAWIARITPLFSNQIVERRRRGGCLAPTPTGRDLVHIGCRKKERERERDRETERERQRQTETDRETETDKEKETERQTDRGRQTDKQRTSLSFPSLFHFPMPTLIPFIDPSWMIINSISKFSVFLNPLFSLQWPFVSLIFG